MNLPHLPMSAYHPQDTMLHIQGVYLLPKHLSAIFFSTHVLDVAEKLCDKVSIIKQGNLIISGSMEAVRGSGSLEDVFMEVVENEK